MRFKKPLDVLLLEASTSGEQTLKRTLGPGNLVALGVGAIIGAGLFVQTARAAAENAGPAITFGFILAAIACALAVNLLYSFLNTFTSLLLLLF